MKSILTLAAMAAFAFTAFAADPTPAKTDKPAPAHCCGAGCKEKCAKADAKKDKCCGEKCSCACCAK